MEGDTLYVFEFSRREIEELDLSRFLGLFKPTDGQNRNPIRKMMGNVTFAISGYDDDPNELYSITEVRRFFQEIQKTWACWLFFSELESPALKIIAFCCLRSLCARKFAGKAGSQVAYDLADMMHFLKDGVGPLEELAELTDMTHIEVEARTDQLLDYFGLN